MKNKRTRTNPYMVGQDDGSDDIGWAGRQSEKRLGESLASRLTKASGASAGDKGDIDTPVWNLKEQYDPNSYSFRIECKSTQAQSLSLKRGWLHKIHREAMGNGQHPALIVSFTNELGQTRYSEDEWVMIPMTLYKELFNDPT